MKVRLFKIVSLCLLLALVSGAVLPAFAAPKKPKLHVETVWVGKNASVTIDNLPSSASYVVEKVLSSNSSVAAAGFHEGTRYAWIEPKKPGKTRITLVYRLDGKVRRLSASYTVKAYPNPFAVLKLNGSRIDLKKKRFEITVDHFKKKSVKVAFSLNKNWKVASLTGETASDDDMGDDRKAFTWKNKKAFPLPLYENCALYITLKNQKTGDTFEYAILIYR